MEHKDIARNPSNIQPGETCYGIYLPAFTPKAMLEPVPGSKEVVQGKAMSSYDCHSADGDNPTAMFLPDEPFENTDAMGSMYGLYNWIIVRSRAEALAVRSSLAKEALVAYAAEQEALSACLR